MAKYTYEQTKKALECCKHKIPKCNKCPIKQTGCAMLIASLALDLINLQEEEIKRLYKLVIEKHKEINRLDEYIQYTKFEAIKEFLERLCEGRELNDPVVIAVKCELKEMVGEKE